MLLTLSVSPAIIIPPLTHSGDGRGNPNYLGCKAPINAVFYCPSKSKAGLFRFKTAMTGCCRQLSSWPFPRCGISTLLQLVAHSVERIATALHSNLGYKPMNTHAKKTLNNSVSDTQPKTSRFNVLDKASKRIIAYKVPFQRAMQYSHQKQTVIKFMGMFGGAA